MTVEKFRSLALNIPGASESAHMGHPDFRLKGRVFATLGYPDARHAMIKLPPQEQKKLVEMAPGVFSRCNGAWGRRGATLVHLSSAQIALIRAVLEEARRNAIRK